MLDQVNATPTPHKRLPWNKGKLTGAKPPLRPKHVWSIWTTLQIEGRARDLTMFNLVIDSKLRGRNLAHERPLCAAIHAKSPVHPQATCRNEVSVGRPLALAERGAGCADDDDRLTWIRSELESSSSLLKNPLATEGA